MRRVRAILVCWAFATVVAFAQSPTPTPEVGKLIAAAMSQGIEPKDRVPLLEAALAKANELKDRCGIAQCHFFLGFTLTLTANLPRAKTELETALPIFREIKDAAGEAMTLTQLGTVHGRAGEFAKAVMVLEPAIEQLKSLGLKGLQAAALQELGHSCRELGRIDRALEAHRNAAALMRELGDPVGEAFATYDTGFVYDRAGRRAEAIPLYRQAIPLFHQIGNGVMEGLTLDSLGRCLEATGKRQEALDAYEKSLTAARLSKDLMQVGRALKSIGSLYEDLGEFAKALARYEEALPVARESKDLAFIAFTLSSMGRVYDRLGKPDKAIVSYEQALVVLKENGDRQTESICLLHIAMIHRVQGNSEKALEYADRALATLRADPKGLTNASVLVDIAFAYEALDQPDKAMQSYEQALALQRAAGDRTGQAMSLRGIGMLHDRLGDPVKAMSYLERALRADREVGNRDGEAFSLRLLTHLSETVSPTLAIWYGKTAVNLTQTLRRDISGMARESRQAYKDKVSDTYRRLANLLIGQGRLIEAEQVMRLLKDDEVFEYVRGADPALGGAATYTPAEKAWDAEYEAKTKSLVELGARAQALLVLDSRTADQEAEFLDVDRRLREAEALFQDFMDRLLAKSKAMKVASNRLERISEAQSIQDTLRKLPAGTVAVYTLAAPDALRLVFVTSSSTRAHTVTVGIEDLNRLVASFRAVLQSPAHDPRPLGKLLYDLLVAPIEGDLKGAKATSIMWSLDGPLRYIPICALWDGKRYVLERYASSIFNPSSLARLERDPEGRWRALAAGVSAARSIVDDDGKTHAFQPLEGVPKELDAVTGAFPGSARLLDAAFTTDALRAQLLNRPNLVHLATHFAFNAGDETKSFLLTGAGPTLSIGQARTMTAISLQGVSLLTLSACETGLGGTFGDGSEVESIAVIFQKKGAEAVLSTLWPVADAPTLKLMEWFYANRTANPKWTKLEALRAAQLKVLAGGVTGVGSTRAGATRTNVDPSWKPYPAELYPTSHPYYWAAFVLSGNWK